jgi:hypothetical protein
MCCGKDVEWFFEYEGTEYAFESHGLASQKRRELGAVGKAPIRSRTKPKTAPTT